MCVSVCVSKNKKNQRGSKKPAWVSVEHGDLKIKINSGFQNSYGPMRVYGLRTIRNNQIFELNLK